MIKVCVVMPTYGRKKITIESLRYMKQQTILPYKIILVGSCQQDRSIVNEVSDIEYLNFTNRPLGSKIQAGFDFARQFNPDAVMLCGSDDWLSTNWIEVMSPYLENYDLCGIDKVYEVKFFDGEEEEIVVVSYEGSDRYGEPLGPGRIFSKRILDKVDWKIFPPLNSGLDLASFELLKSRGARIFHYTGEQIKMLGVVGKWYCKNPWSLVAGHAKLENPHKWLLENFPYLLEMKKTFWGNSASKKRDILFISRDDWSNVGALFAAAGRQVGMDCLSVSQNHHPYDYIVKSLIWKNSDDLQRLSDEFKVIVMMHSKLMPIEKRDWQKWAVFHGGSKYRNNPQRSCKKFNEIIDITLLQHGDFFGFGARNEKWIIPPVDTDYILPVFSDINALRNNGLIFRHNPRDADLKGSSIINSVMKKFETRCKYKYSSETVPWTENIKRMSHCDIYIESLVAPEEWGGITVLEAASLGKIVITKFRDSDKDKYEQEFEYECPIIVVDVEHLHEKIEMLLNLSPEEIITLQRKSREWIENIHGYEATGLRLQDIFELE